ncbi:hypothetical protein GCM10027176_44380 [Actinoallomurus bryophytorum]
MREYAELLRVPQLPAGFVHMATVAMKRLFRKSLSIPYEDRPRRGSDSGRVAVSGDVEEVGPITGRSGWVLSSRGRAVRPL